MGGDSRGRGGGPADSHDASRGADGHFPEDSFNRRVEVRLLELASLRQAFGKTPKEVDEA